MAVPKKKTSVSRKGKRRAGQHHKASSNPAMNCPTTGEWTRAHRVSPSGYYKGKQIFVLRDRSGDEEETAADE